MLDKLMQWVKDGKGNRSVTINIGEPREPDYLRIWTYDYSLMYGQAVESAEEINLEAEKEKADKAEFERLSKKFA